MDRLSDMPTSPCATRRRRMWAVEVMEQKGNQVLVVQHDEAIAAHRLDVAGAYPEGEKTADGVVLAKVGRRAVVLFVELKSTLRPKKSGASRLGEAFEQLDSTVDHFHPAGRKGGDPVHGDAHHDGFGSSDFVEPLPGPDHDVVGVVVTFKQVPRSAPLPPRKLGSKSVIRVAVQVSPAERNRAEIDLAKLLRLAGWS